MDGPGKNSLGTTMMQFLVDRLEAAKAAGNEPILLTGAGDAFSAGLDLREVASLDSKGMAVFLDLLERMTAALYTYPGPLVSVVNGHAIAGGCVVALTSDWRVGPRAASRMKMGLNEVALGLRYPPGVMKLVKKRVDARHIGEIVLGAGLYGADDSFRLGLLDTLAEDPRAAAIKQLEVLGAHPRAAYAAAKSDLRGTLDVSAEEKRTFAEASLPAWTAPELKTRLTKMLSK